MRLPTSRKGDPHNISFPYEEVEARRGASDRCRVFEDCSMQKKKVPAR
jgi:hypothetical protein